MLTTSIAVIVAIAPLTDAAPPRVIAVPGSDATVTLWTEGDTPHYAIRLDGQTVDRVTATSYELRLRSARFDPLIAVAPAPADFAAPSDGQVFIVQMVTQPIPAYRDALDREGVEIVRYLAQHAYIVRMDGDTRERVHELPFVRWIGPYQPAYKLAEAPATVTKRYIIQVMERGLTQKRVVADRVAAIGGAVEPLTPGGFLLEATLTPAHLRVVARTDEVFFIEPWTEPQFFIDNVRIDGGANEVEQIAGYTGAGVRGESLDSGLTMSHQDFQSIPPIIHWRNDVQDWHGTPVHGIMFSDGTGNASARGLIPDAQSIFSTAFILLNNETDRYTHTIQLVDDPYWAVFQTNSWDYAVGPAYTTRSMEMDDVIFDGDLLICQAQANEGNRNSAESAWAKNVVSVGGIRHFNTADRADDRWGNAGSIGPAEDGRIKPDLAYWYDNILTTSNNGGYTQTFGGTSAATPETAGHFGLLFQMWNDGIFGNPVDPEGTVFENRPHAATAKALMINTAHPYDFAGQNHDLTRMHQGWGAANVRQLYDRRDSIFVVDETDVLEVFDVTAHELEVAEATDEFRATMAYADPPGVTSSDQHRINDLTLVVQSPSGAMYYGNVGLVDDNESDEDGEPNTIDTVENVWVCNPEPGVWTVTVRADEINEDSHVETEEIDSDYALVVSGIVRPDGCVADIDDDGDVDFDDLVTVLSAWGPCPKEGDCPADFDNSGAVDFDDLLALLNAWGPC